MMHFGFSGSQRLSRLEREHLTGSNHIRAGWLADLVADRKVAFHYEVDGRMETIPNSAFKAAILDGYTYPKDWVATIQAFEKLLRKYPYLLDAAESQGITLESIDQEIENIRAMDTDRGGRHYA